VAAATQLIQTNFDVELVEINFLIELTALNGREKLNDIPIHSLIQY
jgi:adenine/guanine phosphoribosyltransferase-like PRPP-binding protein